MSDDKKDHLAFFANKEARKVIVADDETRNNRQTVRRADALQQLAENTLQRVKEPNGDIIRRVTFDEYMKMRTDPQFQALGTYMNALLCYADGTPRERPIRPLIENEMGMYRGKIVVITNNPGDGKRDGVVIAMTSPERYKEEREARAKKESK
jgi:hypothetical protein